MGEKAKRDEIDPKFKLDQGLEEEAKKLGAYEMHPLLSKISSKFGLTNMVRNAQNKNKVDIEKLEDTGG